jgi:RHS repeat-associated protein
LSTTALSTPAFGQSAASGPPPLHNNVDANGVDLVSGQFRYGFAEADIGSGEGALSLMRYWGDGAFRTNWSGGLYTASDGFVYAEFGNVADSFTCSGGTCTSRTGNGATLVGNIYTAPDGTRVEYQSASENGYPLQGYDCPNGIQRGDCSIPISMTKPNGMKFTINWTIVEKCTVQAPDCEGGVGTGFYRFQGVSSAAGYSFTVNYVTNNPGQFDAPQSNWYIKTGVTFANAVTACTSACPSLTYSTSGPLTITDGLGRQWKPSSNSIQLPGESSPSTVATIGANGVTSVTRNGVTTGYNRSVAGNTATTVITNALSQSRTVVADISKGRITSVQNELGKTSSNQYDSSGRLTRATLPEGNYTQLTYDARGNVTETRLVSKTPGTPADIVTTASFPASCTYPKTCNQPTWTKDARNNQTDYTYDSNHGGILTVSSPAPTGGAVRPKSTFGYTLTASPVPFEPSVYLLTSVSACQTLASCANGADETRRTTAYTGNLLPTTVTARNGTGTLSATQTMTYDPAGNLLTVDGPLSGTVDTTTFRYDAGRRRVGIISPDPDGASALKRRATRITYRTDNQVSKQEVGNVNGTTDPDWTAFDPAEVVDITYDSNARVTTRKLSSDTGTAYALTQFNYDALGRPDCVATRMNTAIYGSLPASACTLGTQGSFGPDRISKTIYDHASQVTQQQVAVGTADAATEATFTYSNNGKLATLKDAENNLTTYEYDGFDRLSKTRFPTTTKGGGTSSTTDYEQLGYDANSNVTSRRLRDATSIAFTYDNLNRATLKNLPGSEPDVTYGYDNLGRLTSASQTGNALSFTYDALSRNLTQVGPQGTVSSQWDLAGRRTRLTYPGSGLYVDYDYLVTGEMTKIRENGTTWGIGVLATYAYDNLGRRTSLTFGNGAAQASGFDAVSRLSSLTNNLAGTTNDLSQALGYNPAGQIVSNVRTGDAYAWTAHYNENRNYTANGLNQYTASGAIVPTYDSKGNLTSAGTTTYAYSSENMLLSASSGTSASLAYDPALRLYEVTAGASTTRFAYDGLDQIAEYDGSNALLRRHVHGPGVDDPIVWYEGSGTTDRRFLGSDERGSIVSVSDGSGTMFALNSYDEYGIPGAANAGRFQYTGQAWLPELGMYHYKARIYSPTLGRFLQTDPIDVEGGVNLYAYVGNDPVNFVDPLGLDSDDLVIVMGPRAAPQPVFFGGNIMSDLLGSPAVRGVIDCGGRGACSFNPDITVRGKRSKSGIPPVAAANPSQGVCAIQPSTAAQVAAWANTVGEFADGAAVASATLGVVTAPTGAGGAFFGGAALLAGGVGRVAVGVSIVANLIDGNAQGASAQAMTFVGGAAGGFAVRNALGNSIKASRAFGDLSAGQRRAVNVTGEGTAAATGYALGTIGC